MSLYSRARALLVKEFQLENAEARLASVEELPNPSHHRSGSSIDRPTRISKIGNATLPALIGACASIPAIAALVARLRNAGRLKPKQIVVAAMRKLLVICFGVLKTGKPFDPAIAMPA